MDTTQGVLSFNNEVRNAHLSRNLGKYSLYEELLTPAIGEYYEILTRPLVSITNGKSLYDYTHDGENEYSEKITHKYFNGTLEDRDVYDSSKPERTNNFWGGDYRTYFDYVDAVYGHEEWPIRFVDGLLSTEFIQNALKLDSVAVVEDVYPNLSLNGVVKTNVNNFSGTDTRLGLITNQMYATTLYHSAVMNSDRNASNTWLKSHITNGMATVYGNNLITVNSLPMLFKINNETGRVIESYNEKVKIYANVDDINVELNTVYLQDELRKNQNADFVTWKNSNYNKSNGNYYSADKSVGPYLSYLTSRSLELSDRTSVNINLDDLDVSPFSNSDERLIDNGNSPRMGGKMRHIMYDDINGGLVIDPDDNDVSEFDEFEGVIKKTNGDSNNGEIDKKSLLWKTNEVFNEHKIHTIYGEHPVVYGFGNGNFIDKTNTNSETTDTAKSTFGQSRGRNLLRRGASESMKTNGHFNPYCRTWTYHHQYDRINKLIRPVSDERDGGILSVKDLQSWNSNHRAVIKSGNEWLNGGDYLAKNSVLMNDTGIVNITPSSTDSQRKVDIKKCMFSLENLAWKDVPDIEGNLSKEQRGPNGGRIMWFPPYGLDFQENVNVSWEQNVFIGRGEKMYSYANTDRTGTLSFTLLIDHPSVLNDMHNEKGNINIPEYSDIDGDNVSPDYDYDADILRFFAGCSPLKYKKKDEPKIPPIEPPIEGPDPDVKTIRIYTFFPNNYSGHITSESVPTKKGEDSSTDKSDGIFDLLLTDGSNYRNYGVTNSDKYDVKYNLGYEGINSEKDKGMSVWGLYTEEDSNGEETSYIYSRKPNKPYVTNEKICPEYKPKEGDKKQGIDAIRSIYWYPVDFDLRQPGLNKGKAKSDGEVGKIIWESETCYKDLNCFELNVNLVNVKDSALGNKSDADYTFVELFIALSELRKQNCGSNDSETKKRLNIAKRVNKRIHKKEGNEYVYFTEDEVNAIDERILELKRIFSNNTEFISIETFGGATNQDSKNQDMLATRRGASMAALIKAAYNGKGNIYKKDDKGDSTNELIIHQKENDVPTSCDYPRHSINCVEAKRERYCCLEITYKVSTIAKLSEAVSDTSADFDDLTDQQVADIFWEYIYPNSNVLSSYYALTPDIKETFKHVFIDICINGGRGEFDDVELSEKIASEGFKTFGDVIKHFNRDRVKEYYEGKNKFSDEKYALAYIVIILEYFNFINAKNNKKRSKTSSIIDGNSYKILYNDVLELAFSMLNYNEKMSKKIICDIGQEKDEKDKEGNTTKDAIDTTCFSTLLNEETGMVLLEKYKKKIVECDAKILEITEGTGQYEYGGIQYYGMKECDNNLDRVQENLKRLTKELNDLTKSGITESDAAYVNKLREITVSRNELSLWKDRALNTKLFPITGYEAEKTFLVAGLESTIWFKCEHLRVDIDVLKRDCLVYVNDDKTSSLYGKGLLDLQRKRVEKILKKIEEVEAEMENYMNQSDPKKIKATKVLNYQTKLFNLNEIDYKVAKKEEVRLTEIYNKHLLKLSELEKQAEDELTANKLPSLGDALYFFKEYLIAQGDFYDDVTAELQGDTDVRDVFNNNCSYKFMYDTYDAKNPIHPDTYKNLYEFNLMYMCYLLIRWIEDDLCGLDEGGNNKETNIDITSPCNDVFKNIVNNLFDANLELSIDASEYERIDDDGKPYKEKSQTITGITFKDILGLLVCRTRMVNDATNTLTYSLVTKYIDDRVAKALISDKFWNNLVNGTTYNSTYFVANIDKVLGILGEKLKELGNKDNNNDESNNGGENTVIENNNDTDKEEDREVEIPITYQRDIAQSKRQRYETEAEYFSKIAKDDPVIRKKIVDKIKYFDPAFHSMSPEGFNARLTFLQQCCRQGNTIESGSNRDGYAPVAGNLAFGRMPVCVLRIGDFIYSRILINSMSISYGNDGIQWDLNPEGAGVQPMFAKISMPITILGGQSLEGPISKLQNAISFNYYANTPVYDDRADRAKPTFAYDYETTVEIGGQTRDAIGTKYCDTIEEAESGIRNNGAKDLNPRYGTYHYYGWEPDKGK